MLAKGVLGSHWLLLLRYPVAEQKCYQDDKGKQLDLRDF